jgi:hypothetical protein
VTIGTNVLPQMMIRLRVKELARQGFALFVAGLRRILEPERQLRRLVSTPWQARYALRREQQEIIRTAPNRHFRRAGESNRPKNKLAETWPSEISIREPVGTLNGRDQWE